MKLIHAFFAALLAAALTLPLSACSAVLPDAYTVNEDAADAPYALKRTGTLSHSLRHKKSRGFKRDFLWV